VNLSDRQNLLQYSIQDDDYKFVIIALNSPSKLKTSSHEPNSPNLVSLLQKYT